MCALEASQFDFREFRNVGGKFIWMKLPWLGVLSTPQSKTKHPSEWCKTCKTLGWLRVVHQEQCLTSQGWQMGLASREGVQVYRPLVQVYKATDWRIGGSRVAF